MALSIAGYNTTRFDGLLVRSRSVDTGMAVGDPSAQIYGENGTEGLALFSCTDLTKAGTTLDASTAPSVQLFRSRGTILAPLKASSGDVLGKIDFGGYVDASTPLVADTFGFKRTFSIKAITTADLTNTSNSKTKLSFYGVNQSTGVETERFSIDGDTGALGVAAVISTGVVQGTGLKASTGVVNIATTKTPLTAGAAGTTGDICWDSGYIYVCVNTNTWKKVAIASW